MTAICWLGTNKTFVSATNGSEKQRLTQRVHPRFVHQLSLSLAATVALKDGSKAINAETITLTVDKCCQFNRLLGVGGDETRVVAVADRPPLVLIQQFTTEPGGLLAVGVARGEILDKGVDILHEGKDDLGVGLSIGRAQLNRSEPGVRTDIEPEFAAVVDRAGVDHSLFKPLVGLEIRKSGRNPCVGEIFEDLRTRRGQPGIKAVPVRRVGRKGEQRREIPPQFVGDPDGRVGVVDADVDVQSRGRVSVLGVLDTVELGPIAGFGCVIELLPLRRWMEPGGGDPKAVGFGMVGEGLTDRQKRRFRVAGVVNDRRLCLDGTLKQLVIEPILQELRRLAVVDQLLNARDGPAGLVDDEELLFDADGSGSAEYVARACLH